MGMLYKYSFNAPCVRCANCISEYLAKLPFKAFWDQSDKQSIIIYANDNITQNEIEQTLGEHKFKDLKKIPLQQPDQQESSKKDYLIAIAGLTIGFIIWFLPMFITLSTTALFIMGAIATILSIYLGAPAYKNMFKSWSMDTLFGLSSLIALTISILACFVPGLPIMFEVGLMVFGFQRLGIAIRNHGSHKLSQDAYFVNKFTRDVFSYQKDTEIKLLKDTIIPVDCEVIKVHHDVYLDSNLVDGQNHKSVKVGDELLAGHIVKNGSLTVKVTKRYVDSYLNKLDLDLIKAQCTSDHANVKWLKYFIIGVAGLALLSAGLVSWFFSPLMAIHTAVSVMVAACPCTIALINPLTLKIGQNLLLQHGIHIKNFKAIENINNIDQIFFDLTGTLTTGNIEVIQAQSADQNFFSIAKKMESLDQYKSHPIAKAITQYIKDPVDQNINIKDCIFETQETQEHTVVFKKNSQTLGFFKVKDQLRAAAPGVLEQAKKYAKVTILSGAPQAVVDSYAKQLNIAGQGDIKNKLAQVNDLHNFMMIGDAANDRNIMQKSSIGVFIGDTNPYLDIVCDVKLTNISKLPEFIDKAQRIKSHMKQNLYISLAYNAIMLFVASGALLAYGIMMPPVLCAGLMILQSLIVLLNTHRFKNSLNLRSQGTPQLH